MGRIIRKVPEGWEHPKDSDGNYIPMFNKYYGDALNEWLHNHQLWEAGTHPDLLSGDASKEKYPFYAMWNGDAPEIERYQTKKYTPEELTHIQLYEETSEGTPESPVFKADELEKLCEYAAENCTTFANYTASKEEWMEMLKNNVVYSKVGNYFLI